MKKITQFLFTVAVMLIATVTFSQSNLSGTILDSEMNAPLPGANIVEKGTTNGTTSDFDGNFKLKTQSASGEVVISYVGYTPQTVAFSGNQDLGSIALTGDNTLDEVIVVGVVDFAKDRETPVAVSTIRAAEIQDKIGNLELPELLNATPSVYATKSGGGFGDSRINIRGFNQRNTAVMINGMPVNDMENGWVYWSNWAGLSDVTTGMQVQRGLGSSKLAISSVGGTINVLTRSSENKQGGSVGVTTGNDNYLKTVASYSTGKMEGGFSTSILLSRTAGDGYVDGTQFEGYNYFLGFGYQTEKHNLQLTITGAPQTHNQRTTSFFNMATLDNYLEYGKKYNYNHGYLDGQEFNWRKNFYHKPIASLNWDFDINDKSSLSTVLYASVGRGGGTGDIGRDPSFASSSRFRNPDTGLVDWNKIVAYNSGDAVTFYNGTTYQRTPDSDFNYINASSNGGLTRRASMNSHNWVGIVSNFNTELSETLALDVGIDLRSYKGIHYRRIDNLLGSDGYFDDDNVNDPNHTVYPSDVVSSDLSGLWNVFKSTDNEEKIDYYNDGLVRWLGAFTQLEYKKDKISAFIQGAVSQQGYKRIDYFNYLDPDPAQETDWENIMGGNIKGGLNFNIDENHNVFGNAGFYSKQPLFDAVWINFVNELNEDYQNEKVFGLELGYGYTSQNFKAKVNLYYTSWKDRFITVSSDFDVNNTPGDDDDDIEGTTNLQGVEQVHMGIEVEADYKVNDFVSFRGMLSIGDWEYGGDVSGNAFDESQNIVGENTLYLDGVKVGDAAQFTSLLGVVVKPVERLVFDASWRTANNLYAAISAEDFNYEDHDGSLELPSFNLVDAGLSYKLLVGKDKDDSVQLRFNVNNLFNEEYISESATNYSADTDPANNYDGVNKDNKVFFGFGRTWNFGIKYNF